MLNELVVDDLVFLAISLIYETGVTRVLWSNQVVSGVKRSFESTNAYKNSSLEWRIDRICH